MTSVAIDFGTTNTVVSILEPDTQTPKTIRFPAISRLLYDEIPVTPTLIFVKSAEQIVLGEQVRSQRLGISQPDRLFKAFKRDLAADFQPPDRQIDGQSYSVEWVSEQFIQAIWQQLQQQQIYPSQVVFTVPIGAFERYLGWFREVAARLDISDVRLVDESTAAALGYAVQRPGALVLVVDFGGGTLDLSLVRTVGKTSDAQRAEVLAKADAYLGGEDIDLWIVEDYLYQIGSSRAAVGAIGYQTLLEVAERLKVRLSIAEEAKESWLDESTFMAYELRLTRSQLEDILETRQLLEQVRQSLDEVLTIALSKGISKSDIEQVLLVGGSCLIPSVQQLIGSYFGRQRVKLDKPFEAVCHGALALGQLTIEDSLRHSYAIRLWEPYARSYSYFSLFEQGDRYPCQRAEPLILQAAIEGQTDLRLDIGEVAVVAQSEVNYDEQGRMTSLPMRQQETYRSLERQHEQVCVAHLNPPGQVGVDRISVQFEVTDRRVLTATIRDLLTQQILVDRGSIAKLQ
ncbi:Hsp70 family protein [Phormidesmis priestleyi]|uniref:Hsp70 family protein n=1 Tax=Phormidesmis priestleyi TaxID=268141 RepID=UPI00083B6A29|nr:Hsp70 family protein [Phormidesmis priestleyi]